jgi:hypothetical protein
MTKVGLKSLLVQEYLQCTHPVVMLVNKVIQELTITTQHYSLLIRVLLEVFMSAKIRHIDN